jgi:hypothetical protein
VAARSKVHMTLNSSNTGIVGSNNIPGIDLCPHLSVLWCSV